MKESDDNLTPEEKLNQENFVLKSKLILKGGILHDNPEIDPELENMFLKNVLAFENAEVKPLYEILGIDPKEYPPVDSLLESEIAAYLEELTGLFEKHQIYLDLREGVPDKVIYQFLTEEYLLEQTEVVPGFDHIIDGCSGDCPSCFQMDYCSSKDDIWPPDELKAEIERRRKEEEGNNEVV